MQFRHPEARIRQGRRLGALVLVALTVTVLNAAEPPGQDAQPQSVASIAVLNFVNRNPGDGWDWLGKGLADLLITDLSKSASLIVVERERMAWMTKELRLGERGVVDASTAGRFGRFCKVDWVLFGSFIKEDEDLSMEAHIVEVETGRLMRVELVEGEVEELLALQKELALGILNRLHLPLSEEERRRVLQMPTDSVDALARYSFGLDSYDNGDYERAIVEFRLALRKDPEYHGARMRLAAMYFNAGEPEHALVEYRNVLRRDHEGLPTEDVYYQMGRVLERGMGRYTEAIGCYEKILASHKEYEFDRADVQAQITRVSKSRYEQYRAKDQGAKQAARATLEALSARWQGMEKRNRTANRAIEQLVLCYEKIGDRVSAARYCITLLNFLQLHYGYVSGEHGNYLAARIRRKADELYEFILRENLDDRVPMPAEMIRVPEAGLTVDSSDLGEMAQCAVDRIQEAAGGSPQWPVYVGSAGKEFRRVRVSVTTPRHEIPTLVRGISFWEYGPGPSKWTYFPAFRPDTKRGGELRELPSGVRAIRFYPHQGVTQWRVHCDIGPYREAEASERFSRSGYGIMAFPKQVRAIFVDGRRIRIRLGYCGREFPFPPGQHEARVVWSDGTKKSRSFVVEPGKVKEIMVRRDNPFIKGPKPVAERGSSPCLFFDRDGRLWLYWDEARCYSRNAEPSEESDMYFSVSSDGGRTWSEPRLSPVSALNLDMRPVLQQDRYGTYWLVWCSSRDMSDPRALWISSSQDGYQWKYPWKVGLPEPQIDSAAARMENSRPGFSFAISARNVFYISFLGYLWHSTDGKTWGESLPVKVKASGFPGSFCHLHASAGGLTLVGIERDDVLLTTSRDGSSWSEPQVIASAEPGRGVRNASVAVDAFGNCVLVAGRTLGTYGRVKRVGSEWSEPFVTEPYLLGALDSTVAVSAAGRWAVAYASKEGIAMATATNLFGRGDTTLAPSIPGEESEVLATHLRVTPKEKKVSQRVKISGIERVVNLTSGERTEQPDKKRIQIAPGDHLAIAFDNEYTWHYVWTGTEPRPVVFSEGVRARVTGVRRLTNLTTGVRTDEPNKAGIEIAPGDRLAVAVNEHEDWEGVWNGADRSAPSGSFRLFDRGHRWVLTYELLLGHAQAARAVGARSYWQIFSKPELPDSWEFCRDLQSLDLNSSDISDLAPLSVLKSLRYLNLTGCSNIVDLSPLSELTNLTILNLTYCKRIRDISPLSELGNLAWLDLLGCKGVNDLSPLHALPNLQRLTVEAKDEADIAALSEIESLTHLDLTCGGNISKLSPLSRLRSLKSLCLIDFDQIANLAFLSELKGLTSLHLIDCDNVSDLRPICALENLRALRLWRCNKVRSLSALSKRASLTQLDLWHCQNLADLSPLSNLTHLTSLKLSQCGGVVDLMPIASLPELAELVIGPGCGFSEPGMEVFGDMNPECELSY